jgi:hypothetical protein
MSALPSSVVFKPAQTGLFNIKDPRQYEMLKVCKDKLYIERIYVGSS